MAGHLGKVNMKQETASEHQVRPAEVARRFGVSISTLYDLVDRGLLEAPFPVGVRAVAWDESTLRAYLERRRRGEHKVVDEKRAAAYEAKRAGKRPAAAPVASSA
jgi:excisionase family DNA binding protein